MKKGIIAALVIVGLLVVAFGSVGIHWYDSSISYKNAIVAQNEDNQNRYDNFWKSIKEVGQVTDRYKDGFKEVLHGAIEGRYGGGNSGTKACASYIKEQNPALSDASYKKLIDMIEAGRADFRNAQTQLLDKQRAYRNHLESLTGSMFASLFGFPKAVAGDFKPGRDTDGDGVLSVLDYRVVTSTKTQEAFKTGKDDKSIQVFDKE